MSTATREAANDQIAAELRAELGRQRVTISELARRMEVEQSWLNKRLTGIIPLRFGEVYEIASLLKVPLARLSQAMANVTSEMGAVSERLFPHIWALTCGFLFFPARADRRARSLLAASC